MTSIKIALIQLWYSRGRTDSDLARSIKVHQSLVSKWLSGAVEPPIDRKIQIAKAIGVDSRLIFPEEKKT